MKDGSDIATKAADVQAQLQAKLGVKGRSLEHALSRAGHRLPRSARARGQEIVAAQKMAENPKLARRLDGAALGAAYEGLSAHLGAIDVADRRKGKMLSLAGVIVFNLLVVIVGFMVWLWWRGYV
jgi:hypothetical protein